MKNFCNMKWRVWKEKLLLVRSIRNLADHELAKQILEQQLAMGWPGLAQEASEICWTIGLRDITREDVSKLEIKDYINHHHNKEMKEDMENKKKTKELARQDLRGPRNYLANMKMMEARMAARLDMMMVDCAGNMKAKYRGRMECVACMVGAVETQKHLSRA